MSADHERPVPTLELVERYIAGELASEEAKQVAAYLSAHESAATALTALREAVAFSDGRERDVARRWMELVDRLGVGDHRATELSARGGAEDRLFKRFTEGREGAMRKQTLRRVLWPIGATAIGLTSLLLSRNTPRTTETTYTYTTRPGQQATFTLNDGTRITLAPQTTFRVAHFGASSRTVDLDGQAYFEVARLTGAPFIVHSGVVSAQVLGTTFLVRSYAGDNHAHIAVAEGKVRIVPEVLTQRREVLPVTLTAGHTGDVTDSTILVHSIDDVALETSWLQGQLVFHRAAVNVVLQTLSRWYGYQFRCSDSLLTQERVTVALDARSSMEALATLGEMLDVHVTVVGNTVTLTQQPKQATGGASRKRVYDMWIPTREAGK